MAENIWWKAGHGLQDGYDSWQVCPRPIPHHLWRWRWKLHINIVKKTALVHLSAICISMTIIVLLTSGISGAQTPDSGQYGEGTVTLEMYRQRQIEQQLEMERQQIEIQRQQLQMQRQQIEIQRQQLENQRQQIEYQRQQLEMEMEKQRSRKQDKQAE